MQIKNFIARNEEHIFLEIVLQMYKHSYPNLLCNLSTQFSDVIHLSPHIC